jgi:hypothetical protein
MARPLQEAALDLLRRARAGDQTFLREFYALGETFLKIKQQPELFGAMSDVQLGQFFDERDLDLFRQARRIRQRYAPERFEEILAARNEKTGFRFTLDHLVVLLQVEDVALADEFLVLALTDSWTPQQLNRAVKKKLRQQAGPNPKTKMSLAKPASLPGLLANIDSVTGDWLEQFDEIWQRGRALGEAYGAIPEEKIDPALVRLLEKQRDQAVSAANAQLELIDEMERLRDRAQDVIRRRRGGGGQ